MGRCGGLRRKVGDGRGPVSEVKIESRGPCALAKDLKISSRIEKQWRTHHLVLSAQKFSRLNWTDRIECTVVVCCTL